MLDNDSNASYNINLQDKWNRTPLHRASELKRNWALHPLIQYGSNVFLEDYNSEKPIDNPMVTMKIFKLAYNENYNNEKQRAFAENLRSSLEDYWKTLSYEDIESRYNKTSHIVEFGKDIRTCPTSHNFL